MHAPENKRRSLRSKLLMRGESVIASTGLALIAIFMMAIAGAGGWAVYTERQAAREHLETGLQTTARLLADSIAPLLDSPDGGTDIRNLLISASSDHGLVRCRLVTGEGSILADAMPAKIAVRDARELPKIQPDPEEFKRNLLEAEAPVTSATARAATVQVAGRVHYTLWTGWQAETGIGVIGAAGFIAFLAVYRHLRSRLRAVGAIREALIAATQGETSAAVLSVSDKFGPEAGAWNALLLERERLKKDLLSERARETLGARSDSRTDLAEACDALWQGLLVLDEGLNIRYANGAAAVFLRARRETLSGAKIADHAKDPQVLEAIKGIASGQLRRRATLEVKQPESEGGGILRFSIRPVRREDPAAAIVMIEDITQQRIADEAHNAFVAQATHELRTPLTNIRLYVEQAIEAAEDDKLTRAKALDVINQESRRLERIVADMLSVSEIEAGSFKLRAGDVRLEHLFDDLKGEYEAQAAEKKITLSLRLPPKLPVIRGDRDKIVLALHNLLGNAIKYTPEGGKVEVRVDTDADHVKVEVSDTGIGIASEETELIFEKFYRAKDKRVSQITGTGLGLALAREVVRLHGGDITVQSQLDKGSTFTLTIPTLAQAA
jgi:signal transduction histidine kinase